MDYLPQSCLLRNDVWVLGFRVQFVRLLRSYFPRNDGVFSTIFLVLKHLPDSTLSKILTLFIFFIDKKTNQKNLG